MCAKCQREDFPEWCKGPNGPKELCNACGLRYAKSLIPNHKSSFFFFLYSSSFSFVILQLLHHIPHYKQQQASNII
jgi:hypothetical protein